MNVKDQEELNILRKINDKNLKSQRQIAKDMGISLGKLNYCLKALQSVLYLFTFSIPDLIAPTKSDINDPDLVSLIIYILFYILYYTVDGKN